MYAEEIQAHLERANSSLAAARLLLTADLQNDAASRAYYASFHAASALLLSRHLSFGSHTGVLRAFSLHFVKTAVVDKRYGRDLNWLAELRQVADYGELQNVSTADAAAAIAAANRFIAKVGQLLDEV